MDCPLIFTLARGPCFYPVLARKNSLFAFGPGFSIHHQLHWRRSVLWQHRLINKVNVFGQPTHNKRRASKIPNRIDRFTQAQTVRQFNDRTLSVTKEQQISLRINQDRPPDLIVPIVIMRQPPEARLNRPHHKRNPGKRLSATLGIYNDRPIWPLTCGPVRRISIIVSALSVSRVVIHH